MNWTISVQTGEILLPVSKWPCKRKNGSNLGCDVITRIHTSSLQSLDEDLTFFTSVVYNTKSQETQIKIFLQQLKAQSMNSDIYVTLSNLDPFFLLRGHFESGSKISSVWTLIAPRRKIQIKNFFAVYIRTIKQILNMKNPASDIYTLKKKRAVDVVHTYTYPLSSRIYQVKKLS